MKRLLYKLLSSASAFLHDHPKWGEKNGRKQFMRNAFKMLHFNAMTGDYAEFGSCGGNTFRLAWDEIKKHKLDCHLFSFDSFDGLPSTKNQLDMHPRWEEGSMKTAINKFHRICGQHGIPDSHYTVIPGYYETTLVRPEWQDKKTKFSTRVYRLRFVFINMRCVGLYQSNG